MLLQLGIIPTEGMNRLLAALAPHDRDRLTPHLKELHLDRGRVLFEAGQPIEMAGRSILLFELIGDADG